MTADEKTEFLTRILSLFYDSLQSSFKVVKLKALQLLQVICETNLNVFGSAEKLKILSQISSFVESNVIFCNFALLIILKGHR